MKKYMNGLVFIITVIFFVTACKFKGQDKNTKPKTDKVCNFSFSEDSTDIIWTGYKFNDRAAVKGTFDSILISNNKSSDKPLKTLEGIRFSINTSSVNSNDKGRDKKISEIYFNTLNTLYITGGIDSVDYLMNRAILALNMNGIEIKKEVKFNLKDNVVELNINLDISDWNGSEAVNALNKACEEKHTGKDKESVLWSDVDVIVRTRLIKDCK